MAINFRKIALYAYGYTGWQFIINGVDEYRTNKQGEGLFRWCEPDGDYIFGESGWKQERGICQFSLPKRRKSAYSKIYREFFGEKE